MMMASVQNNPFRKNGSLKQKNEYDADGRIFTGYGKGKRLVVKDDGTPWKINKHQLTTSKRALYYT